MLETTVSLTQQSLLSAAFGAEQQLEGSRTAQAVQGEPSFSPVNALGAKNAAKRKAIMGSLLQDEKEYVANLNRLWNAYLKPLKEMANEKKDVITLSEAIDICSNLEVLLGCHGR